MANSNNSNNRVPPPTSSVHSWLKEIRYETECYDNKTSTSSSSSARNKNLNATAAPAPIATTATGSESASDCKFLAVTKSQPAAKYEYENIWELQSAIRNASAGAGDRQPKDNGKESKQIPSASTTTTSSSTSGSSGSGNINNNINGAEGVTRSPSAKELVKRFSDSNYTPPPAAEASGNSAGKSGPAAAGSTPPAPAKQKNRYSSFLEKERSKLIEEIAKNANSPADNDRQAGKPAIDSPVQVRAGVAVAPQAPVKRSSSSTSADVGQSIRNPHSIHDKDRDASVRRSASDKILVIKNENYAGYRCSGGSALKTFGGSLQNQSNFVAAAKDKSSPRLDNRSYCSSSSDSSLSIESVASTTASSSFGSFDSLKKQNKKEHQHSSAIFDERDEKRNDPLPRASSPVSISSQPQHQRQHQRAIAKDIPKETKGPSDTKAYAGSPSGFGHLSSVDKTSQKQQQVKLEGGRRKEEKQSTFYLDDHQQQQNKRTENQASQKKPVPAKRTHIVNATSHFYVNIDDIHKKKNLKTEEAAKEEENNNKTTETKAENAYVNVDTFRTVNKGQESDKQQQRSKKEVSSSSSTNLNLLHPKNAIAGSGFPSYENVKLTAVGSSGDNNDNEQQRTREQVAAKRKSKTLELLKLNYGQIQRLSSVEFHESLDDFFATAQCLRCLDFSLKAEVLQWQTELLMHGCCEEEEVDMQDFANSLESINAEKMTGVATTGSNPKIVLSNVAASGNDDVSTMIREKLSDSRYVADVRPKTNCFDEMRQIEQSAPKKYSIKYIYENKEKKKHCGIQVTNYNITIYFEPNPKEICLFDVHNLKPISKKELTFTIGKEEAAGTLIRLVFDTQKDLMAVLEDVHNRQERKHTYSSNPDIAAGDSKERSQIKTTLLKLLGKRSKRDLLEKKGIIQNEAIFGNTLNKLHEKFGSPVPRFVTEVIGLIELKENITSMGLYRASGNLATMQKIRFNVDIHRYDVLEDYKHETDVLTGALKMFFRELKEPLLPYDAYKKLLDVCEESMNDTKKFDKMKCILKQIPEAHYKTLVFLIQHLIKVEENKLENKMDTYNLSICWGPTLTWPSPSEESRNESLFISSTSSSKVVDMLIKAYRTELLVDKHKNAILRELKNRTKSDSQESVVHHQASPTPTEKSTTSSSSSSLNTTSSSSQQASVDQQSTKGPLNRDGVFGSTLELICQDTNRTVPEFVLKMIELIERNVATVGIYRISGNITKVDKIKRKVNKNKLKYLDEHRQEVFELTSAFKQFFNELHEPLIPNRIFEHLVDCCGEPNPQERWVTINKLLDRMNMYHRDTLQCLLRHLVKVSRQDHVNRMSLDNLARIWGQTLMYSCYQDPEKAEQSQKVVELLMKHQMALDEILEAQETSAANLAPNDSSLHRRSKILLAQVQRKSLYATSADTKV